MITKLINIRKDFYMHARPAGQLALEAQKYQSMILLFKGEYVIDVKSAISLMNASEYLKDQVELVIDGKDE